MAISGSNDESYIKRYLHFRYWILATVAISILVAFFYLKNTAPVYRIRARAQIHFTGPAGAAEITKQIQHLRSVTLEKTILQFPTIDNSYEYELKFSITQDPANKEEIVIKLPERDRRRGIMLIDQLIRDFNKENTPANIPKAISDQLLRDSIVLIDKEIALLQQKIAAAKSRPVQRRPAPTPAPVVQVKLSDNAVKQLRLLNQILPHLKDPGSQFDLVPYADEIIDPELQQQVLRYNGLQSDKQSKLKDRGENDPAVENINKKLVSQAQGIKEKIENLKTQIKGSAQPVVVPQPEVEPEETIVKPVNTAPLERAIAAKLADKNRISEKIKLIKQQNEAPKKPQPIVPQLVMLNPPSAPSDTEFSREFFAYLLAIIIGLLIPGVIPLLSFGREEDSGINEFADVKRLTHTPLYGTFRLDENLTSESSAVPDPTMAINNHIDTRRKSQTILITSAIESGAQVIFSKFLAQKLAKSKKTVLVDLNFSQPHVLKSFKVSENIGVINFIEDPSATVDNLLAHSKSKTLDLIGIGSMKESNGHQADELIDHPRVGALLKKLSTRFDYVLLDAPSICNPEALFPLIPFADLEIITLGESRELKTQLSDIDNLVENKQFGNPTIFYLG